jgi:outer membrane protein assembly factor BamB
MVACWGSLRLAVLIAGFAALSPAWAWVEDVPPANPGAGSSVATDAGGNVVAAGVAGFTTRVVRFDGATGKALWTVDLGSELFVTLAVAANGDPIVCGEPGVGAEGTDVVRRAAATGTEVWRYTMTPAGDGFPGLAALDASGDVLVAGVTEVGVSDRALTVVKLDGATGAELWRVEVSPGTGFNNSARSLVAAADGDALVAGLLDPETFLVLRLDGASGAEDWRFTEGVFLPGSEIVNIASSVVEDPGGDVVAAGAIEAGGDSNTADFTVLKLDGATGGELWRYAVADTISGARAVPDANGDVLAAHGYLAVKLAGVTGTPLWTQALSHFVAHTRLTAGSDLLVAGVSRAFRLDGNTGLPRWSITFGQPDVGLGFPDASQPAVALDPSDRLAITGGVQHFLPSGNPTTDFVVGGLSDRVSGAMLRLRDSGQPAARSLVVKSKDPRLAASGLDGLGDPTLGGGTLTLTNPTTAESVSYPLPAAGWRARPKREPLAAGYQYSDPAGTYGPCHAVSLKSGRKLVIKCRGAAFAFTLDEASQGSLAVRLTTGSGIAGEGFRYCLRFDGTVLDDRPGLFLAKDAPAPPTCLGDP